MTYAACAVCLCRCRSGGLRPGGVYLLLPCGHVARVVLMRDEEGL